MDISLSNSFGKRNEKDRVNIDALASEAFLWGRIDCSTQIPPTKGIPMEDIASRHTNHAFSDN